MATHSSVLAWRNPGTGEPGGVLSMGSHRVGYDWSNLAAVFLKRWEYRTTLPASWGICMQFKKQQLEPDMEQCSVQFSSVQSLSRVRLCDPMNHSTPGLPVHHQLPEFTQTHVHWVSDAIQPSHPLSSPSPPAPNPSQHQSLLQWVNSSHEVAKVLEFQL